MRHLALTLLPAALLLTGAAPVGSINDMAECRLSYADMRAVAATVPLRDKADSSEGQTRRIANYYQGTMPTAFGFHANDFGSTDMLDSGGERYMIITTYAETFEEVRSAAVAVHGQEACPIDQSGATCLGPIRTEGEWQVNLLITHANGKTSVGCAYKRPARS